MKDEEIEILVGLAEGAPLAGDLASSRLRSRIYSAMMLAAEAEGPLRALDQTCADGRELCVFEKLVEISPAGAAIQSLNYCRTCHARVLGETVENAPIHWHGCPYAAFKNG